MNNENKDQENKDQENKEPDYITQLYREYEDYNNEANADADMAYEVNFWSDDFEKEFNNYIDKYY